jgi:hypothetical protein
MNRPKKRVPHAKSRLRAMIRVPKTPQAEAVELKVLEGDIISAGFTDWFRWRVDQRKLKLTIGLVDFYSPQQVLCNFLNNSDLENSIVAGFAQLHWRAFQFGGLFLRLGSRRSQQALRKEIKESVVSLLEPDSAKLSAVQRRLNQYPMHIALLQVDTSPVMAHLVDVSKRKRGADKTGVIYDGNTMEVRSRKISSGGKTIIVTAGMAY